MPRNPVLGGVARTRARGVSSIACLAIVLIVAAAFWAGVVWIGEAILRMNGGF